MFTGDRFDLYALITGIFLSTVIFIALGNRQDGADFTRELKGRTNGLINFLHLAFSILIYINYRDVFELVSIDKIY